MSIPSSGRRRVARLILAAGLFFLAPGAPGAAYADQEGLRSAPQSLPGAGFFKKPSAEAPPFFPVKGGDGADLFLLGTVHLGPEEGWTYPRSIRRALDKAETVMLEIDPRLLDEETVSQAVFERVLLPDGQRLSKILSPETRALVEQYDREFAAAGLPFLAREGLYPWFVATSLIELASTRSGYSGKASADSQVIAALGGREFIAFETFEEQLGFFSALDLSVQDLLLRDTLERWDESTDSVKELVQAWQRGDTKKLGELSREGLAEHPELDDFFDVLLDQRNQAWANQLIPMLEDPERAGTEIFVGVGAFHLIGPDSLPDLLQKAGYRVKGKYQ